MAFRITSRCIACGVCLDECVNGAIAAGDDGYYIHPERCTECVGNFAEPRCADICPASACNRDPSRPETQQELLTRWQELHPGETPRAL